MSKGKKKRGDQEQGIDSHEKELFLKAFFDGEIPKAPDEKKAGLPNADLEESDEHLFLRAVNHGLGHALPKDKPKAKASASVKPRNRAQRRGTPDATIDLHGLMVLDAMKHLEGFLKFELNRGSKTVLVIHGKGAGVLRDAVWSLIERHTEVLDFQVAPAKLGGGGALLVRLQRKPKGRIF